MSHPAPEPPGLSFVDGVPYSARYGDTYFSRQGGLAEARHVFLNGNELSRRWRENDIFVIGETGFGTGLNFLVTWAEWARTRPPGARLHYLSVERHPLSRDELRCSLGYWPELSEWRDRLIERYPVPRRGMYRCEFRDQGLTLTLLFGEAAAMLADVEASVDAWYLDGFAPAQNPEMWNSRVISQIARLSRTGTTLSTYTVAGDVRRRLDEYGFNVEKRPGFGRKREMLTARYKGDSLQSNSAPWFQLPKTCPRMRQAIVVGAGIAGLTVAHALLRRGWTVRVIEAAATAADAASGNPAGVVMPRLGRTWTCEIEFLLMSFESAVAELNALESMSGRELLHNRHGVLQLARDPAESERFNGIPGALGIGEDTVRVVDRDEACEIAGIDLPTGGLHFPEAGWVEPKTLARTLIEIADSRHKGRFHLDTDMRMEGLQRREQNWVVTTGQGELHTETLVLATGAAALPAEELTASLSLYPAGGQTGLIRPTHGTRALQAVVREEGYVIPMDADCHLIGAAYRPGRHMSAPEAEAQTENLGRWRRLFPTEADSPVHLKSRAATRASTDDRLPLVGPVPDARAFRADYASLHHGPRHAVFPPARHHPGLYASLGHGSRGLTTAYLSAEVIAAMLCNEPLPVPLPVLEAILPARHLVRELKRPPSA